MRIKTITLALLALLGLPLGIAAESTQLATWNFATGYDTSGNVYTPNGSTEWAETTAWFKSGQPSIIANKAVGNTSDYVLSAMTARYWQFCNGYNNKVFRMVNDTETNDISDMTDGTQHNNYYELRFPTKGYQNITLDMACAYGGNAAATLEAVVSTDNGATWFGAGTYTCANTWWTYDKQTLNIPANDKQQVIVRLIAGNGYKSNWNLEYATISGEVKESVKVENQQATVTYVFDQGTEGQTATYSDGTAGWFKSSYVTVGATLSYNGASLNQTKLQPSISNESSANDNNAVKFMFAPMNGLKFTPTKVSFNTTRYGTNGGKVDVSWINSDGTVTTLDTEVVPARNNDVTVFSKEITGAAASDGLCGLQLNLYSLGNNKQVGFGNIVIEGIVSGEVADVPMYTFTTGTVQAGAGCVRVTPAGVEFAEGDEIEVLATENFGYHFSGWQDADGNTVSTENPYKFTITANTTLKAAYTQKNVYALNLSYTNGAKKQLVTVAPEGKMINGIHNYEEGTEVKLTAVNNKILTFTGWDDNSTAAERTIVMDGEKNITANYSATDYIVAWDLWEDQPAQERAADFKSESDNAGLLSVRQTDGSTSSWLAGGHEKGMQNGKYCARIWRKIADKWYFEMSFSTKGYKNVTVSNALGDDFNAYSTMTAQYSTDGENFTDVCTFTLPDRGWDEQTYTLPANADNQDKIWVRWMPDYSSPLVGVTSDNDGTSIAEIFVTADLDVTDDTEAPNLLSSNPADGANGITANGSIVLNFNEKMIAGTGNADLNGETLTPTLSGKTVVYTYSALKYNTQYIFNLPAGALTDKSGNKCDAITISFTTMERTAPTPKVFDAIVAKDGSGDYTTVQDAIDAAPAAQIKPWLIFVKNGEYKEHIDIPANKPFIHITGQDRDKTVILDDKLCGGEGALHVSKGATVVVNSNDCYFDNITLENSYGHEKQAGPQALALNTIGDRTIFHNVAMLSYQDTWITPSNGTYRTFAKNCLIEGAVDFIYNSGDCYFDSDTLLINRKSGGFIVAPSHGSEVKWGYVFQNTTITAPGVPSETDVWLGRPWHNFPKTVFINTRAEVTIPAAGWYETMGGLPKLWAEYNTMDGEGNPVDLSQRRTEYYYTDRDTNEKVYGKSDKAVLTAEEAAQYTVKNVCSGNDNWQPDMLTEQCDAPVPVIKDNVLTWEAVPYAICYVVTQNGKVVEITTGTSIDDASGEYCVQAVSEQGSMSRKGISTVNVAIESINVSNAGTATGKYNLHGQRVSDSYKGVVIKNGKKMVRR